MSTSSAIARGRLAADADFRRQLQVLYAEDMPELRTLLTLIIGTDGHEIETVPDGAAAWRLIRPAPRRYDLLITDHHMPEMNGLELVTRVRQSDFSGKILIVSSELSPLVQDCYQRLGVDWILAKPFHPRELRSVLRLLFPAGMA